MSNNLTIPQKVFIYKSEKSLYDKTQVAAWEIL